MKRSKLFMFCLAAALSTSALASAGRRVPIHGSWSTENPAYFQSDTKLRVDRSYLISNNTPYTISVLQVEIVWDSIAQAYGRVARGYANIGAGQTWEMEAPPYLAGDVYYADLFVIEPGIKFTGKNGVTITEGPEIATN